MNESELKNLLESIAAGIIPVSAGMEQLRSFPSETVGNFAVIDRQRELRTGFRSDLWAGKNG